MAENTQPTAQIVTRRPRMGRFRQNYSANPEQMVGVDFTPTSFAAGEEIAMLKAISLANVTRILNTALAECNLSDTAAQQSGFYMSVLSCMFPGLYDLSVAMFAEAGYRVRTYNEDNMAVELSAELRPWIDAPASLTIFAQLTLIMYKNIDARSYAHYMQARTAAIKVEAGMSGSLTDGSVEVLLTLEVAKNIRTFVGASPRIRAAVLNMILANRDGDGRLNKVCNYLAEIISWTEMSPLVFIFEQLCLTKSPILADPRVRNEMAHLSIAFNRITSKKYPQYYRIFNPTEAGVTIIRSRFGTLFEVARRAMALQNETVNRFQSSDRASNTLVEVLFHRHMAHLARQQEDRSLLTFDYLTNFNLEDEDEVAASTAN